MCVYFIITKTSLQFSTSGFFVVIHNLADNWINSEVLRTIVQIQKKVGDDILLNEQINNANKNIIKKQTICCSCDMAIRDDFHFSEPGRVLINVLEAHVRVYQKLKVCNFWFYLVVFHNM